MICTVVVQVATCQQIVEQDIRDLISVMTEEQEDYIAPLLEKIDVYSSMIGDEVRLLDEARTELTRDLQYLALELNTQGVDVSICLDIATEDLERIFTDRCTYAFTG